MSKILALDLSTHDVGYTIAEGEGYRLSGQWKPRGDEATRFNAIVLWVAQIIEEHQVTILALEEPAVVRSAKVDRLLARAVGNAEGVGRLNGCQIILIHQSTVKATHFSKDHPRAAADLVGKATVGEHEADSIGVWQATLCRLQELHLTEKAHEQ